MNNSRRFSRWVGLFVPLLVATLVIGCGKAARPAPPQVDLQTAVATGNLPAVRQHIAAGSDLNQLDATSQSTPLINASVFGRVEIAKALIEAKADLNTKNKDGSTALIVAAFFGHPDIVRSLLDHGANASIRNNMGGNALETVESPWDGIKPIYDMIRGMLAPTGLVLDYERIQAARPKIAVMLRGAGAGNPKEAVAKQAVATAPDFAVESIVPKGAERYLSIDSNYIFDQDRLPTFELRIPGSSLAKLDANPTAEEYVQGSLTFEGETISPVEIRYKGSVGAWVGGVSGFNPVRPSGQKIRTKLSVKVKFDGIGSGKKFYGLNKLQFHSQNSDPSQMHERLGFWLFREMGVPAPRSVHARLVINGKYSGLYALTEQVDGRFTRFHFGGGEGNLYKEVWPLDPEGRPREESAFLKQLKTNESENPRAEMMMNFAREIAAAGDSQLTNVIARWMNVREIISLAVVDRAIRNDDGPFHWYCFGGECMNHNYFWYEEPKTGKVHLIPSDLDNSFENIIQSANPVTPIADDWGKTRADCKPFNHGPFNIPQRSAACDKLTKGWASFEKEYRDLRTRLIEGPLSAAQADSRIDVWSRQIREATAEANQIHPDALTLASWEQAVGQLKAQLNFARSQGARTNQ